MVTHMVTHAKMIISAVLYNIITLLNKTDAILQYLCMRHIKTNKLLHCILGTKNVVNFLINVIYIYNIYIYVLCRFQHIYMISICALYIIMRYRMRYHALPSEVATYYHVIAPYKLRYNALPSNF